MFEMMLSTFCHVKFHDGRHGLMGINDAGASGAFAGSVTRLA